MKSLTKKVCLLLAAALTVPAALLYSASATSHIQAPGVAAAEPAEPTAAPQPMTQPATPGEGATPGGLMDRAVDSGSQIYVDDSFSSVEKLHAAMRLDSQKQTQLAIQRYQEIIDEFGQKLVYLNNDFYVSLTDYVRQRLLAMPGVQKGEYDQLYGPQATKAISEAAAAADLPRLVQACDRYFPSVAAVDGLAQAAEWYFERAEFAAAARTWEALLAHPRAGDRQAIFLHHAAMAESLGGRSAQAVELRERLAKDFPNATGVIDGKEVVLLNHLDAILQTPAWEHPALPADEWPTFQGSPSRTALSNANAEAGAQLWSTAISLAPTGFNPSGDPNIILLQQRGIINVRGRLVVNNGLQPAESGPALSSYPVMSNGTLFVHTGDHVLAMGVNAGNVVWSYPPAKGNDAGNAGDPNIINALRLPTHDSCTLFGDQVFAILPTAATRGPMRVFSGVPNQPGTRLVALNRMTGQPDWSVEASSLPLNVRGTLAFVGSPLVTRQGVFALVRKLGGDTFTQLYLARLDRNSGRVGWTCYLCSASSGGMYGLSGPMTVPLLAMADDVAYISTGQGADCAVDANAGRILWLQVTESAKNNPGLFGPYGRPFEVVASWKFNPPLVYRDRLITAESGAAIRIYDRWTGQLLGRINPKEIDNASVIPGIVDDRLITVGQKVHAIDLATGDDAWEPVTLPPSAQAGLLAGRAFLSEKALYVPMEKGLVVIDVQKGGPATFSIWPKSVVENKETPGHPGNLLVTNEQIVVISDTDVSAYSRWETARDNRLAAIAKSPRDPHVYLDLAEVAFRTGHFDLAETNMRQAVDLAQNSPTQPDVDFLAQLYQMNLSFAEQLMRRDETEVRDRARFYFGEARVTARTPEASAQWRLVMAPFSLDQKREDEAADLYNQILTDSSLRSAMFHHDQTTSHAGLAAETRFAALIDAQGRQELGIKDSATTTPSKSEILAAGRRRVYKRFEDQAAALLARGRSQQDLAALQNVVDSFPNSVAALSAAADLARVFKDRTDPIHQIDILRWTYLHSVKPEEQARTAAELALAHIALHRYSLAWSWAQRGQSHMPTLTWVDAGKAQSFSQLRDMLRSLAPDLAEPHRATFGLPADPPEVASVASGMLLTPLEGDTFKHRPDLIVSYIPLQGRITFTDSETLKTRSSCVLPERATAALLLGFVRDRALVATATSVYAIDFEAGTIAWRVAMPPGVNDPQQQQRIRILQQGQRPQIQIVGGGVLVVDNANGQISITSDQTILDAEQGRASQFLTAFSRQGLVPGFQTLRLLGNHLVVLAGHELRAFDVETGKPSWFPVPLPAEGNANIVVGNDDLLVAQVDTQFNGQDRATTTFVAVDAATGRNPRTLKLDSEHIFWRALGEDGTLYAVSDTAVGAYDMNIQGPVPRWRRDDIHTHYPAASTLTLDGLVVVDSNNDLNCLSQESGDARWDHSNRIDVSPDSNSPSPFYLFAKGDGDNVNIQSSNHITAYRTLDGEKAWGDPFGSDDQPHPTFLPAQIGNPYLVILASGATPKNPHEVALYMFNRVNPATGELTNGKLAPTIPLQRKGSLEGPNVRNWQLVNGGIVFDIPDSIYMLREKKTK